MKTETDLEVRERALAMDRAFIMSRLFSKEYFPKIVNAINISDKTNRKLGFYAAFGIDEKNIGEAGNDDFTALQINWLWNYLQHFNPEKVWCANPSPGW